MKNGGRAETEEMFTNKNLKCYALVLHPRYFLCIFFIFQEVKGKDKDKMTGDCRYIVSVK